MKISGARAAVKTLKAHELRLVFGIPGVQNLEYFDAFTAEGMQVVLVSHELAAAFMADAVGRVTGRPGVVAVVPGPGLTNMFTGLGEALLDSAPLVALVPGVRSDYQESFQLHEIDHEGAARALAKCYLRAERTDEIAAVIARAIQCARSGEPGPVIVEAPYNALLGYTSETSAEPLPLEYPGASDSDLDRAAELILASRRPGIHVGAGAAGAAEAVIELAERLDAPVSTTISGRGVIPEDHPLAAGFGFGPAGTELAERAFADRDLVLAVGCKFSEVGSGGYSLKMPRLIHVDANPAVLGKNFPAELAIAGDAETVLQALLGRVCACRPTPERSPLRELIQAGQEERRRKLDGMAPWPESVNPVRLLRELRARAPRDAILTTDSGAHTFFTLFAFDAYQPRTILSPIDYSSMGYGLPAAIGASLAAPGRRVIAAVGDGGLLMTGTELATVARLQLPLLIVLFNDRALGLIKQTQAAYGREVAVELPGLDWEKFAGAFGVDYLRIERDGEVGAVLDQAFGLGRAVLIDARVEYRHHTRHTAGSAKAFIKRLPPTILARMAARAAWRAISS